MAKRFAISIAGWDEYQERPDRANYTWCKLHQKTITGHFWQSATLEQKALWVTLLCMRNAQQESVIHTIDFVLAGYCGVKASEIEKNIDGLIGLGVIQDVSGQFPGNTRDDSRQFPGLELELEKKERREEKSRSAGRVPAPPFTAPQLVGDYSPRGREILDAASEETQGAWIAAYPDPAWIKQEINKAAAWISANPKKPPKRLAVFMGNWLSRGWEKFRKTIPSTPGGSAAPIDYGRVFGGAKDAS